MLSFERCAILLLLLLPVTNAAADTDQQKITASLADIRAGVGDLRTQVAELRTDIRNDRSAMLQRTNGFDKKLGDLSTRVDDLDVSHVSLNVEGNAARIAALETARSIETTERAVAEKKTADSEANEMLWVREAAMAVFGILATGLFQLVVSRIHRLRMEAGMGRMEAKADKAYREANGYAAREEKTAARQEAQDVTQHKQNARQDRQDDRQERQDAARDAVQKQAR